MRDLPNIDRDRLEGFRRMANSVLDDMLEAALDAAGRHEHQVDLLKARVAELEADVSRQLEVVTALRYEMNDATTVLGEAIGADVPTLAKAVPAVVAKLQAAPAPQFFDGEKARAQLAAIPMEQGPFVITMKIPAGRRFMATSGGDVVWCIDPAAAQQFGRRALAEGVKPRKSAVVTLADAHELVQAEKVLAITTPPPGPEAA